MTDGTDRIGAVGGDGLLTLPDGWSETAFEREEYALAGERRAGLATTFEGPEASTGVVPVAFEHTARGRLRIERLDGGTMVDRTAVPPETPVGRRVAFATELAYERAGSRRRVVYTVAEDADDALAVACWLAVAVGRGYSPDRATRRHRGTDGTSDDDRVLAALRGGGRPVSRLRQPDDEPPGRAALSLRPAAVGLPDRVPGGAGGAQPGRRAPGGRLPQRLVGARPRGVGVRGARRARGGRALPPVAGGRRPRSGRPRRACRLPPARRGVARTLHS